MRICLTFEELFKSFRNFKAFPCGFKTFKRYPRRNFWSMLLTSENQVGNLQMNRVITESLQKNQVGTGFEEN